MHLRFVVPVDVGRPTGGNVYDLALAEALRAQGDRVDLVRCSPADLAERAPGPGQVMIDGLLASDQPKVVRGSGAAVLVHMPLAWRDPGSAGEEAEALQAARVVVATSHWTARFLKESYGVEAVVVPPGVEPAQVEGGSDPLLIGQVAALAPHKDQLRVVAALAEVVELRWRARLIGSHDADPAYAAHVVALVGELGLTERIELPGELPRDAAFVGIDLLLLPSRVEAFGMVVTEGLARGIPCIVSSGGPAEALGTTRAGDIPGWLVEPAETTPLLVEPVETTLPTALRRWLTEADHRAELRRHALTRRTELTGWDVAAGQLLGALAGPVP